jgi:IS5 family transposase
VKVDSYLRDEKLYRLIKKDLSKRWPKTKETGRNSTPGEVILRMLVVKRLYGYSYEETERNVSDSLNLRRFCRVYLHRVPDDTTLMRWANLIQPQTLAKFNQRILQLAIERKVTKGRKLRTDGTVVESNIRPPSDNRLLADSVRVLVRTLVQARTILKTRGQKVQVELEDFTQTAKQLARQIGETLRTKTETAISEITQNDPNSCGLGLPNSKAVEKTIRAASPTFSTNFRNFHSTRRASHGPNRPPHSARRKGSGHREDRESL